VDYIYPLTVTTPAGTAEATPQATPWPLDDNFMPYFRYIVPPGPSGCVGFRLLWAEQQVYPFSNYSWLVTDDDKQQIDLNLAMTSSGLVVQTYNTGAWPHTIQFLACIRVVSASDQEAINEATGAIALPASADTSSSDTTGIDTLVAS
jgi:hypothetical protein